MHPAFLDGVTAKGHADALCLCSDGYVKCTSPPTDCEGEPCIKNVSQCCCIEHRCAIPCDSEVPCMINVICINFVTQWRLDLEVLKTARLLTLPKAPVRRAPRCSVERLEKRSVIS